MSFLKKYAICCGYDMEKPTCDVSISNPNKEASLHVENKSMTTLCAKFGSQFYK